MIAGTCSTDWQWTSGSLQVDLEVELLTWTSTSRHCDCCFCSNVAVSTSEATLALVIDRAARAVNCDGLPHDVVPSVGQSGSSTPLCGARGYGTFVKLFVSHTKYPSLQQWCHVEGS